MLRDGNVSLARAKAAKLIKEDALGDVLEVLGMHLGVVLDHFHELERRYVEGIVSNRCDV